MQFWLLWKVSPKSPPPSGGVHGRNQQGLKTFKPPKDLEEKKLEVPLLHEMR